MWLLSEKLNYVLFHYFATGDTISPYIKLRQQGEIKGNLNILTFQFAVIDEDLSLPNNVN